MIRASKANFLKENVKNVEQPKGIRAVTVEYI